MSGTLVSNTSNLSRLNRYFDTQPLPPHPTQPPQPMRAHVTLARPPKHNNCTLNTNNTSNGVPITPSVQPPPPGTTIDGAACKTSTWTYKHVSAKTGGVAFIEKGARVRADKRARRPVQKLNWKDSPWPKGFSSSSAKSDYLDLDTRTPCVSSACDVSPRLAVKRVTLLASHQQYRDAASFIHRLPSVTVRSALADLPMDTLVEAMPLSLPVIEALYCTAGEVSPDALHVDRVVWQMVRFFAQQEECLTGDIRWEFCGPFVNLCRDVLRVVARIHPTLRRSLMQRRRQLERAIEGMGHHGLVGTSDESLTSLHDALKLEFEKVVKSYTSALSTLQELVGGNKGHISKGPAPIQASHQRQLSIAPHDIQERLIKNKSLLNIVEPTLGNHSLDILLGILQRRIEHDKDALFQFTQLRKEAKDIEADAVVAPILMRYAHGCDQVLDMLRELMEEAGCVDALAEDDALSDVSGYHSDSDSAIMMSGNSPYVTKHARFNFLTRSVRDRSRVGNRLSLPMTSSGLPSSGTSSSPASSGVSCSSSAVGSDTQSQRGSDGGSGGESSSPKGGSPAPLSGHGGEDTGSVLKAPSDTASGVSTIAGVGSVASRAELEALRTELTQARQTIRLMHEREKEYKERLNERSSRLDHDRPPCVRVTSPIRQSSYNNNNLSNNHHSNASHTITTPTTIYKSHDSNKCPKDGDSSNNKSDNKCTDVNCDGRSNNLRRPDLVRSKSVVNLCEETSGSQAVSKHWAQSYSKEYPKGYIIKDSSSCHHSCTPYTKSAKNSSNVVPSQDYNSRSYINNVRKDKALNSNRASQAIRDINSCVNNYIYNDSTNVDQLSKRSSAIIVAGLNGRLENLALGDRRPSALVRRYGNLYTQARLETLDALDDLTEMRSAAELKSKLVFSVVVLAFRSASATATALRQDVRRTLQVHPLPADEASTNPIHQSMISINQKGVKVSSQVPSTGAHFAVANSVKGMTQGSASDVAALEAAMATVIASNVDNHDLTRNVEDVCQQIWATLYDYPGLKDCEGLLRYIKECVRVAWGLVNQSPPYCIEYEARTFRNDLHVRFHTSDSSSDAVRTYLWPALTEGASGPCVHKGVVTT